LVNQLIQDKTKQTTFRENCKKAASNLIWDIEVKAIRKWYA